MFPHCALSADFKTFPFLVLFSVRGSFLPLSFVPVIESLLRWLSEITLFLTEILHTFQARMAKYNITSSLIISIINLKCYVTSPLLWLPTPKAVWSQLVRDFVSICILYLYKLFQSCVTLFYQYKLQTSKEGSVIPPYTWENWDSICSNEQTQGRPMILSAI